MVSAEIAQNLKWHLVFEKGVFFFYTGEKLVLLTVFLKSGVLLKTLFFFIVFSANTAVAIKKLYVENITENLWKIVGCFWTWQNGVFGFFFFLRFEWFCGLFLCVWYSCKSVKMLVFFSPVFLGFCVVVYSCLFWVWKVKVFCGSCFSFLLLRFCFCSFWL